MTDTNPPEVLWSTSRGEFLRAGRDGEYVVLAGVADLPALPGDAVRLVPQTGVDTQRALTGSWQRQYAEMKQRAVEAEDQRGVAWQQLKAILALFDADSDCMEPGDTAEFVREQLARLREHAIQLPEDWRQQIDQVARANLGWYPQLVDAITALVESWRTATHPTPQGVMPIECDGGPYCEATKHYDFCQRRPAPETSEPREDWYPQIGDKVEAIADGEIMTVIPRQPMMAQADGFVHVESEHGQRWYLTPDTLRPVVVPTGEDTPE